MGALCFIGHATISAMYGYSIYVYCWGIHPPKEISEVRTNTYGPFKYLTFWDLVSLAFILHVLVFMTC